MWPTTRRAELTCAHAFDPSAPRPPLPTPIPREDETTLSFRCTQGLQTEMFMSACWLVEEDRADGPASSGPLRKLAIKEPLAAERACGGGRGWRGVGGTVGGREPASSGFVAGLPCAMQKNISIISPSCWSEMRGEDGYWLLKTVHFWRMFEVHPSGRVKPFFPVRNVCSRDHRALWMCLRRASQALPCLIVIVQIENHAMWRSPVWNSDQGLVLVLVLVLLVFFFSYARSSLKLRQRKTWSDYRTKDAFEGHTEPIMFIL